MLKKPDFIMDTTHPGCPEYTDDRDGWAAKIIDFASAVKFIHLVGAPRPFAVLRGTQAPRRAPRRACLGARRGLRRVQRRYTQVIFDDVDEDDYT